MKKQNTFSLLTTYAKLYAIVILLIPPVFLQAQTFNGVYNLHWGVGNGHIITNTATNISSINIVENLPDTIFIGIAPSSVPNERTNLEIPGGVKYALQTLMNQSYEASFKKKGTPIVWSLNNLSIGSDSSNNGIVSYTQLEADIYKKEVDGGNQFIGRFDTLIISNEANPDFEANISVELNGLYQKTVSALASPNSITTSLSTQNMVASPASNYKIFSDSKYAIGVFANFDEFKNDSTSIKRFYIHINNDSTRQLQFYQPVAEGTPPLIDNVWGISVDNELYVYQNGQLYPIEKYGNGFYLSKYLNPLQRKNQGIFWRRHIGHLQGDENPFDDKHVYRVPVDSSSTTKIETTHLDMTTGNLTF